MLDDEETLREKARAAIASGKLPDRPPDRTWAGPGVGALCTICDLPVRKDEMEFEVEFDRDGSRRGLDKFHMHMPCFTIWEGERK